MKNTILILALLLLNACSWGVDRPQNLIPKEQMVDLLVDLALYEKANMQDINNQTPIIAETLLKKYKIKAKDLEENYAYYLAQNDVMTQIYQQAQDKILEQDPKLAEKIKKKEAEKEKEKNNPTGNKPY